MALKKESYYAIEALTFLCKHGEDIPWTVEEITIILTLNWEVKEKLNKLKEDCSAEDIKKTIKEVQNEGIKIRDKNTIRKALNQLKVSNFILTLTRSGTHITHAGRNATLYQILKLFEHVKLTSCTQNPKSFDCPREKIGKCVTYKFYDEIGVFLKKILEKITVKDLIEKKCDIKEIIKSIGD